MSAIVHTLQLLGFVIWTASAVRCPDGWTSAGCYCYNLTTDVPLSWHEAKASCEKSGGHLIVEGQPNEHVTFAQYRDSLSYSEDPVWIGSYAYSGTSMKWARLKDSPPPSLIDMYWKDGKYPQPQLGLCIASFGYNNSQAWIPPNCSQPLSYVCETSALNTTDHQVAGGATYTTANHFRNWHKVYQNSTCMLTQFIVNANMTRTSSLASCAVTCSNAVWCLAFNHRRSDNMCQFILTKVNCTNIYVNEGWDVWVDLTLV